ncbi:MAG: hypothetical protein K0Q48_2452, partial [Bacillota bacterium]|nr:hypothetical protein [Bacillota bacterium]
MKKKWICILLVMLMTAALFAGCSGSSAPAEDDAAKKLDYSTVKIGEITSLVVNDGG